MASSFPPEGVPIALVGAPDTGKSASDSRPLQVMHLDMSSQVLEELLAAARDGKQAQVSFGRSPVLSFGSRSLPLTHRLARIRPEVYQVKQDDSWQFAGHVSHNLSIHKESDPSAGLDEALAMLKNNMASIEKEREARKTITLATKHKISKPTKLLQPHDITVDADMNRSTIDWIIKHKTPAIRHAVVHLLAIKPETLQECSRRTGALKVAIEPILGKIATKNANDEWEMGNKSFKEVKPWSFKYKPEQRQAVIDKAIKAYDRLRIEPKDAVWQDLLPPAERNKGKILSRLAFNSQALTPNLTPKLVDKKTGLPRKPDSKQSSETKLKEKLPGKLSPHPNKPKEKEDNAKAGKLNVGSSKDVSKNGLKNSARLGQSPARQPIKESRASAPAKALLNRPRNPSPLSKSPPVNASDFEDGHPVHKTLSAAPSPSRSGVAGSAKRKLHESLEVHTKEPSSKKARLDGVINGAQASRASPAVKRKAEEHSRSNSTSSSDNTPLKIRRLANNSSVDKVRSATAKSSHGSAASKVTPAARPRSSTQVSDDSSVTSPDYALSHSKRLRLAEEFKRLYSKYKHLHIQLSSRREPPSKDDMARLMDMHNRVADMKKSLAAQ